MVNLSRSGESFLVSNGIGAALEAARLVPHKRGIDAEVIVRAGGVEHWECLNLGRGSDRGALAKAMAERCPEIVGWRTFLDEACFEIAKAFRVGEGSEAIVGAPPDRQSWLVPGLIPTGEATLIYGDGDSLKSLTALALAWAGRRGEPLSPAWRVAPLTRVLFLDWESSAREARARWWGLCQGAGIDSLSGVVYRRMRVPLIDAIEGVAAEVIEGGFDLVLVDSFAPACGAGPEKPDTVVPLFNAFRALPCTKLVIAHVTHASAANPDTPSRPYGSVFVRNLARSTIEARADDPSPLDGSVRVVYTHTKNNAGARRAPSALRWAFDRGSITVSGTESAGEATLGARILALLRGTRMDGPELAGALGEDGAIIRAELHRLKARGLVDKAAGAWGLRAPTSRGGQAWRD